MTNPKRIPKIYIIILIYNGMKWIDECFTSVLNDNYPNCEILAIDNKSPDESIDYIKKNFPQIKLIKNDKNYGFAEGNNVGMRYALKNGANYIVLLNQDIKVEQNWLVPLIEYAEQNKKIGVLTPIQYNYKGTDIDPLFKRILRKTSFFEDEKNKCIKSFYRIPEVIGASVVISCKLLSEIGLFDPFYFMYYEEYDLFRRAVLRGYEFGCVTKSIVYHNHVGIHQSCLSEKIKYLKCRNKIIYYLKDPAHSFIYNLKYAYYWTNWLEIFQDCKSKHLMMLRVLIVTLFLLPYLYIKRFFEIKGACYFEKSTCKN